MDVKELRIGNRVLADGIPSTVMAITAGGKIVVKTDRWRQVDAAPQANNSDKDCKVVEPMPITPELLKAYGFEYIEQELGYYNFYRIEVFDRYNHAFIFDITNEDEAEGEYVFYNWDIHIAFKYVHELQNFISSISGQELEVKI